jgi:hypothetical protein
LDLQSPVLTAEVSTGAMQPLSDRVRVDVEHDRDLGNGQVLPRREQEYFDIGVTEVCDRVEDETAGLVVEDCFVSG